MQKYTVRYTETSYVEREIEAGSRDEAEEKMIDMVCGDKIDMSEAEHYDSKCEVVDEEQKKFETKVEWVDVETIQEFLADYGLFSKEERIHEANWIAKWICDTLNKEPEFPYEMFETFELKTFKTYYIHFLFDRGMTHGTVTMMPDMYGSIPDNAPSYVVLDRELDEDGRYIEKKDDEI